MKEQMRIVTKIGNTSEVARQTTSTPRMVDDLTTSAQRSYSKGGEIFMAENTGDIHQSVNPDQKNSPIERTLSVGDSRLKEVVKPRSRHTPPIPVAGGQDQEEVSPEQQPVREFIEQLAGLLKDEKVREELSKDNPNFTRGNVPKLTEFMDRYIDPTSTTTFRFFADLITQPSPEERTVRIGREEIAIPRISYESRRVLLEWLLEKIIAIPDVAPEAPYRSLINSISIVENQSHLLNLARARFEPEDVQYFGELVHVREVAHELNRSLSYGQQYKSYVTEHLRTAGLDFMQNDLAAVNVVLRLYEKIAANKVAQNKLWFTQEGQQAEEITSEVETVFSDLVDRGLVIKGERPLTEWEKARALRVGRIFFAGTQRLSVYAGLGDIPPEVMMSGRFGSLPYEFIVRAIYPFKLIAPRFFGTPGPKKFMEMTFEEQLKGNENEYPGLFGLDKRTIVMDDYGAQDTESHGWRSDLLFYRNIKLIEKGKEVSFSDYLNQEAERVVKSSEGIQWDPILGRYSLSPEDKIEFSRNVQDRILGQRLYLSVLARYGNFDDVPKKDKNGNEISPGLRTKIWQKIALLKPSTIASLLPDTVSDKEVWERLRHKLYTAEEERVSGEANDYRKPLSDSYLRNEKEMFEETLAIAKKEANWTAEDRQNLREYMDMRSLDLDEEEQVALESLIKNGVRKAEDLAKARMRFTFVIDDAPVITWRSDENLIRILISDQDDYTKAWNEINALVEYPTIGVAEHFSKAVDGIGNVIGRNGAQDTIEPFITAYLKLVATKDSIVWLPGAKSLSKLTRTPTSEIEKYYRNTFISLDEQERADFLLALSQAKAIRDDLVDIKEGITQLDTIRRKTKSGRMAMFLWWARTIILLFGPVAGYEFIKAVVPGDMLK